MKIVIFLLLTVFPSVAFAVSTGDVVGPCFDDLNSYEVTGSSASLSMTMSDGSVGSTSGCADECGSYSGSVINVYIDGYVNGDLCNYTFQRWDAVLYVAQEPAFPQALGSEFGQFTYPIIELLAPVNEYTAIFNYMFSLSFWFTMLLLPIKWVIKLFKR